jgi:dienelactone hydrolase
MTDMITGMARTEGNDPAVTTPSIKPTETVKYWSMGVQCAADLYLQDRPGPHPGVVMGHGTNMTKEALRPHAKYLHAAGYNVMAIDYQGLGESEGAVRGEIFPRRQSYDFRNAITYFSRRPEVDETNIGIWGVSLAGGVVLHVAAFDQRVKCIVSQSAIVNGRRRMRDLRSPYQYNQLLMQLQNHFEDSYGPAPEWEKVPMSGELTIPMPGGDMMSMLPPFDPQNPNPISHPVESQKTFNPYISLESTLQMLDWNPSEVIDLISPRPLLMIANGGQGHDYDWTHTPQAIQDAYELAGDPKEIRYLPYGMLNLYDEPGLGVAMALAVDFYDKSLKTSA